MAADGGGEASTSGEGKANFTTKKRTPRTSFLDRDQILDELLDIPSGSEASDDDFSDGDWIPDCNQSVLGLAFDYDNELADDDVDDEDELVVECAPGKRKNTPNKQKKTVKKSKREIQIEEQGWQMEDNDCLGRPPPFLGIHKVNVDDGEPYELFCQLFTAEIIDNIVFNSNLYAFQTKHECLGLTADELRVFLGINLIMSYIKYPRMRLYWSSDPALRLSIIADAMTVNRFESIRRFLHFVDNTSKSANEPDRFFKIRPFLTQLQESFLSAVDPEEYMSVDEQIIPLKSRISVKQYLPKKPKKWGVKIWVRAGVSGYMYRFDMYQGAARETAISSLGATADVVITLCSDIHNKNHKVFFDNLFCSIPLLEHLKGIGIYGTGTCRTNRMSAADHFLKSQKALEGEGRGSSSTTTNKNNISVTRWMDNNLVHVASSYAGQNPEDQAERWSKKEKKLVTIKRPAAIQVYNQNMGGVDLLDQLIACYANRIKAKRWYLRVFFHFLDVTCANGWIISKMNGNADRDLLEFKASVARALLSVGTLKQQKRGRPSSKSPVLKKKPVSKVYNEVRFSTGDHWPQFQKDSKHANRCRSDLCLRKTRYTCMKCNVPLCPDCFKTFHTR